MLKFPARDPRVVSVGGTGLDLAFWNESPGGTTDCPYAPSTNECGSNYAADTSPFSDAHQELVAPAKAVRSTIYPNRNWNTVVECGDSFGEGAANDGMGLCTGTSMSAPILAGLYGLLRSINPLMRAGDPVNRAFPAGPDGIREVVVQTASRSALGLPEDTKLGFGIPSAAAAVAKLLGQVRGEALSNRLTPLFGLYSPGGRDYAAVATPQLAMALTLYSTNAYRSTPQAGDTFLPGAAIPGYAAFPNATAGNPRARALILTTESKPYLGYPTPIPLYLLKKKRPSPTPCDTAQPTCHGDFILLTSTTQVEAAVANGYLYAGLPGYVYGTCSPAPACQPIGTQPLHLKCHRAHQDCAVVSIHGSLVEQIRRIDFYPKPISQRKTSS